MAPTRVGLIGLTSVVPTQETYSSGQWGLQHLAALRQSPHYEIVAVCNSTAESAAKAIDAHKLGSHVKAYGSSEELAKDPNVDLVVISVHVDKHFSLARPVLLQKKDLYLEFPVAPTLAEVEELAALAKQSGVRTIIGAQAVSDASLRKVRDLIKSNAIGDVVLSRFSGHNPLVPTDGWIDELKIFFDLDAGVSRQNIILGHVLAPYIATLGDFDFVQSILKVQYKTIKLFDSSGNITDPAYKITAPDTILLNGIHTNGAVSSVDIRTTRSPVDDVGFHWAITGMLGEILFTTTPGYIQGGDPEAKITLRLSGGEAQAIEVEKSHHEHISGTGPTATNIARTYEAFATGDEEGYITIDGALITHKILEKVVKSAKWAP